MQEIINSFGLDWKIFAAELVNFLVVLIILYHFVFKKIFKNLDKRREIIKDGIKKSEMADKVLVEAEKKKDDIIKEARSEASEKINQAVILSKNKETEILSRAEKEAEKIISESKKKAEDKKNEIIFSANQEIAKLAILGAEKVLREK